MLIHGPVLHVISRTYTNTHFSCMHAMHGHVVHCLVSLCISFFFSFTHTPSSHLIAFPFFLQRDLWLGECWRQAITMSCLNSSVRQSGRGGSSYIHRPLLQHTLLLHASLAHVNPAPVAARSPTLPCFSSALGSRVVLRFPIWLEAGCEAPPALEGIRCLLHKSESL